MTIPGLLSAQARLCDRSIHYAIQRRVQIPKHQLMVLAIWGSPPPMPVIYERSAPIRVAEANLCREFAEPVPDRGEG
jgi:hypothetical protein